MRRRRWWPPPLELLVAAPPHQQHRHCIPRRPVVLRCAPWPWNISHCRRSPSRDFVSSWLTMIISLNGRWPSLVHRIHYIRAVTSRRIWNSPMIIHIRHHPYASSPRYGIRMSMRTVIYAYLYCIPRWMIRRAANCHANAGIPHRMSAPYSSRSYRYSTSPTHIRQRMLMPQWCIADGGTHR